MGFDILDVDRARVVHRVVLHQEQVGGVHVDGHPVVVQRLDVVWAGLLPTVKARSKVSMSPSTATTRVSRGVFEVDVDCALLAGEHAASRGSPTPNPRAATAPSVRTSRRVSKARRACTSSASSNRLRSLCLIRYLPNEVVAASFEAAVASCRASP